MVVNIDDLLTKESNLSFTVFSTSYSILDASVLYNTSAAPFLIVFVLNDKCPASLYAISITSGIPSLSINT